MLDRIEAALAEAIERVGGAIEDSLVFIACAADGHRAHYSAGVQRERVREIIAEAKAENPTLTIESAEVACRCLRKWHSVFDDA